jgi:ATP-dependent Clp protease ATP-binding subunit ClpC
MTSSYSTALEEKDLRQIVKLMLREVSNRLKNQEIDIEFDEEAEKLLSKEGFDPAYGARPLRRTITKVVEDKLSEEILRGNIKRGDKVCATVEDGKLVLKTLINQ